MAFYLECFRNRFSHLGVKGELRKAFLPFLTVNDILKKRLAITLQRIIPYSQVPYLLYSLLHHIPDNSNLPDLPHSEGSPDGLFLN